jgi:hypothetical protein
VGFCSAVVVFGWRPSAPEALPLVVPAICIWAIGPFRGLYLADRAPARLQRARARCTSGSAGFGLAFAAEGLAAWLNGGR